MTPLAEPVFEPNATEDSTNATRGSASKRLSLHAQTQRYRIEFFSNRMLIPILYTMICSFQGGREMGLIITWSLVVRMPFYCCLGTLHQAVFMKSSSHDLQERSWSHQLRVKLPDLGLDQDHYPKVRVSPVENLLPNSNSSAPVTWY